MLRENGEGEVARGGGEGARRRPQVPRLRRVPLVGGAVEPPDPAQRRVVDTPAGSGPLVVLGAPGTGRTRTLRELVATRVERDGLAPDRVLVLAPSRRSADLLRDDLSRRLRRTTGQPAARTPQSYAFGLLRLVHARDGAPPPRLISGAEQDAILAELLRGHLAVTSPEGPDAAELPELDPAGASTATGGLRVPGWPSDVPCASWGLRSFRNELRDLLMRAVERGLGPADLADLGRAHARPEWCAAADLLEEYLAVNALGRADAYDPAGVVDEAVAALRAEPELLAAERARWDLVAVDDAHDLSEAALRLLEVVAGGRDLVLATDPDSVTQGFRGADARTAAELADRFGPRPGVGATTVVLGTDHRQRPLLHAVSRAVSTRIGALGGAPQRAARPAPEVAAERGRVEVAVLASATQEASWVAQRLRRRHLLDGVPWSRMAVVVRSAGHTAALRRSLAAAGVPLAVPLAEVPVRDEPAVRPLLSALAVVLDPAALDDAAARELVTSPLGGADVVALRRLRQSLRRSELAAGGGRTSDAVLTSALAGALAAPATDLAAATGDLALLGADDPALGPAVRVALVLQAGRRALAAAGTSAETVLWHLWDASGLAARWQRAALAGAVVEGADAGRADRDLDAVLALFEAAGRFEDRFPGAGSARRFLDQLMAAEVPSDTLADRAPDAGAVTLTTPQGAVGREWDLVVVAGVQEGVWPDLRLRGSVLGAQALVDVLQGRDPDGPGARRAVLEDELRLFHVAVTRAREELVVTAVRDEDERPSAFLDVVADAAGLRTRADEEEEPGLATVPRAVSLPALVARLRQVVCAPDATETPQRRAAAAARLAELAAAGVAGADPSEWYGAQELTDDGALRGPGEEVPVSPSRVESFERCGLRWLLESSGARPGDSTGQAIGNLVHRIASEAPEADAFELRRRLDLLWPTLGLPDGWVAETARARALRMVDKLAEYHRDARAEGRTLVGVELDVDVQVGRARVRGRVDRLERDAEGRAVVVDLKTGKVQPSRAEVERSPQLGVYQLAAQEGAFPAPPTGPTGPTGTGGAVLVQLGGTQKKAPVQRQRALDEDDDPGWAADLLARAAEGMAAGRFEAVVGPHCGSCPVLSSCPAQEAGRSVVEEGR
ncbi:superfamily I DNA/RNA helicase/RecB family exonuclease [Kineococcus radiotolerans]|uniref:DNA 3'-5' helicase n=1 Tax=Kineococcus radiotolerans TaxID=131568 RepID=A0A7W4XVS7_KINRA|nr:ATP-dependent DNA helicase [Kineococcus radiotolerans]MBB2900153.1 superfamily I DNA/RNA helicase/RecB family exonuclease [Kineococcus radiotolerans]